MMLLVMTSMGYVFLEHTADIMIEAYGASLSETFSFAAKAMFDVMFDTSKVVPRRTVKINVSASDLEGLLCLWLEELLYKFDVDKVAFSSFEFALTSDNGFMRGVGKASGEPYDPRVHSRRTEVKAVTYEEMLVTKTSNGYKARFTLDI
jgi:SHS2 domain-containing protein